MLSGEWIRRCRGTACAMSIRFVVHGPLCAPGTARAAAPAAYFPIDERLRRWICERGGRIVEEPFNGDASFALVEYEAQPHIRPGWPEETFRPNWSAGDGFGARYPSSWEVQQVQGA